MSFKIARLLALAPVIAACATNTTRIRDGTDESILDALRAENKGIVLIHTTLHDQLCNQVIAGVAHPDASGRYVAAEDIALKRILNRRGMPSEVTLPAGDYGLIRLECNSSIQPSNFVTRPAESGNMFTGEGAVYDQPIAKFSVQAGEFVDVGSLQLPSRITGVFLPTGEFKAYVVPNADNAVQTLAAAKPALYAHLVHRLMTTPGQTLQPRATASPGPAR